MLAATTASLPPSTALPGGCWYEPKFDGYRAIVFVGADGRCVVQSRRGADLTSAFPDIAAAAREQLRPGDVVDGELVIWTENRPDFAGLQRRITRRKKAVELAQSEPANLVIFDLLATGGVDTRPLPLSERRTLLERLSRAWTPPLQLVPGTSDLHQAELWLEDYRRADVGVEGLVIKGLGTPYTGGTRGWLKFKVRDTVEAVVGAVIGTPEDAERLVLGHYDEAGVLHLVGSTHALHRQHRRELREHLLSASGDHPWPSEIASGRLGHWGTRERIALHRVDPVVVVEISADRSFDHGRWRHLTRFVRVRVDLDARSVIRR